jgi:hypothetical protein
VLHLWCCRNIQAPAPLRRQVRPSASHLPQQLCMALLTWKWCRCCCCCCCGCCV